MPLGLSGVAGSLVRSLSAKLSVSDKGRVGVGLTFVGGRRGNFQKPKTNFYADRLPPGSVNAWARSMLVMTVGTPPEERRG
jgi:hypothetical protein